MNFLVFIQVIIFLLLIQNCNTELQYRAAIQNCNTELQYRTAIQSCNTELQYRAATMACLPTTPSGKNNLGLVLPDNDEWQTKERPKWIGQQFNPVRLPDGTRVSLLESPVPRNVSGKAFPISACLCYIGYKRCFNGMAYSDHAEGDIICCLGSSKPCVMNSYNKSHIKYTSATHEWDRIHKNCPCRLPSCEIPIVVGFRKCETRGCFNVCVFGMSGRSRWCVDCGEKKHGKPFEPRQCIARPLRSMDNRAKRQVIMLCIKYEVEQFVPTMVLAEIIASYSCPDFNKDAVNLNDFI